MLVPRLAGETGEGPVLAGDLVLVRELGDAGGMPEAALVEGQGIGREVIWLPAEHVANRALPDRPVQAGKPVDEIGADIVEPRLPRGLECLMSLARRVEAIETRKDAVSRLWTPRLIGSPPARR